jgi:hypothetical protein
MQRLLRAVLFCFMSNIASAQTVGEQTALQPPSLPYNQSTAQNNRLILDGSNSTPFGQVLKFTTAAAVTAYYGAGSLQDGIGQSYFSVSAPAGSVLGFFRDPFAAGRARIYGGAVTASSLTAEPISATYNGATYTGGNVTVSGPVSGWASAINAALNTTPPTIANCTGSIAPESVSVTGSLYGNWLYVTAASPGTLVIGGFVQISGITPAIQILSQQPQSGPQGGTGTYLLSNAGTTVINSTITETYGLLTIDPTSGCSFGTPVVGMRVTGAGVTAYTSGVPCSGGTTPTACGTAITAQVSPGSGAGSNGSTWVVDLSQTVASTAIGIRGPPLEVTYNATPVSSFTLEEPPFYGEGHSSVASYPTGAAAADLGWTQAKGAYLASPGWDPVDPWSFLDQFAIRKLWSNFGSFQTIYTLTPGASPPTQQSLLESQAASYYGGRYQYLSDCNHATLPAGVTGSCSVISLGTDSETGSTASVSATVPAGANLVVVVNDGALATGDLAGCTGTVEGPLQKIGATAFQVVSSAPDGGLGVYYFPNSPGGSDTITCTKAGFGRISMTAFYIPSNAPLYVDMVSAPQNGGNIAPSFTGPTPNQANDIFICAIGFRNGATSYTMPRWSTQPPIAVTGNAQANVGVGVKNGVGFNSFACHVNFGSGTAWSGIVVGLSTHGCQQSISTFNTVGSGSITVPANCYQANLYDWGAGASGTAGTSLAGGFGGGSGGYSSSITVAVSPGQTLFYDLMPSSSGNVTCWSTFAACSGTLLGVANAAFNNTAVVAATFSCPTAGVGATCVESPGVSGIAPSSTGGGGGGSSYGPAGTGRVAGAAGFASGSGGAGACGSASGAGAAAGGSAGGAGGVGGSGQAGGVGGTSGTIAGGNGANGSGGGGGFGTPTGTGGAGGTGSLFSGPTFISATTPIDCGSGGAGGGAGTVTGGNGGNGGPSAGGGGAGTGPTTRGTAGLGGVPQAGAIFGN